MEVEGRCYCGEVRYRAEGDVGMRVQCHCRECQYISGGGPVLILGMPTAGFAYTEGAPRQFTRSDIENPVTREFCGNCGTHVTTVLPGFPMVMIKVGSLDDPSVFEGPDMVLYTMDQQAFHQIPQGVPSFEGRPG